MSSDQVSRALAHHYSATFEKYGATPQGVDWGPNALEHQLRLDKMIDVIRRGRPEDRKPSLLDVGSGYGSLLDRAIDRKVNIQYTGIEICQPMVELARVRHPHAEWLCANFLTIDLPDRYDYVVCNGILTQKLDVSIREMDEFLKVLVRKMFSVCNAGIAFNVMSSSVNFMAPNLYYRSPAELLAWCTSEITPKVILDSAYPLFEFTLYLYREGAVGPRHEGRSGELWL